MKIISKMVYLLVIFIFFPYITFGQSNTKIVSILPFYVLSDVPKEYQNDIYNFFIKKLSDDKGYKVTPQDEIINYLRSKNISENEMVFDEDLLAIINTINSDFVVFSIMNSDVNKNITILSKVFDKNGNKNIFESSNILNYGVEISETAGNSIGLHLQNLFTFKTIQDTTKTTIADDSKQITDNYVFYSDTDNNKVIILPSYNLASDDIEKSIDEVISYLVGEIRKNSQFYLPDTKTIRDALLRNKINTDQVLVNEELQDILNKTKNDMLIYTITNKKSDGEIEFYTKVINKLGKVDILTNNMREKDDTIPTYSGETKQIASLIYNKMVEKSSAQTFSIDYKFPSEFYIEQKPINFSKYFDYIDNYMEIDKENIQLSSIYDDRFVKDDRFVSITNSNTKAVITSRENNRLYQFDIFTGVIEKEMQDDEISNISTPAIFYNDGVLFINDKKLFYFKEKSGFVFKKADKKRTIIDIDSSSGFWALPLVYKNLAILPVSSKVMTFDGTKLENLDITGLIGQTLLTIEGDDLYIVDSFGVRVFRYNMQTEQVVWRSNQIKDITVFAPVSVNKNIVVLSDIKNKIYIFDSEVQSPAKEVLLRAGISSNILLNESFLYFIARDGFFYSLNIINDNLKRIVKVDKNPNIDKYLTKKIAKYKNFIIFCSDRGGLFAYDIVNGFYEFVKVTDENVSLLGTPIVYNDDVYLIDSKSNKYKISNFSLLK